MKSLQTLITEGLAVTEASSYPQKIKILKDLYLHIDRNDYEKSGWSLSKSSQNNGSLKKGETYVFNHTFNPGHNQPLGLNYNDENGKQGPEFLQLELEQLIKSNAIQEIVGFTKQ